MWMRVCGCEGVCHGESEGGCVMVRGCVVCVCV